MDVTINIGGLLEYLLIGADNIPDDDAEVIGISRVAYLTKKDPGHVFIGPARWHDAAYVKGSQAQLEGWRQWEVDLQFLKDMLQIAGNDYELRKEAAILYLAVAKYGSKAWEGEV